MSGYAQLEGVTVENGQNEDVEMLRPARPADVEEAVEEEIKVLPCPKTRLVDQA